MQEQDLALASSKTIKTQREAAQATSVYEKKYVSRDIDKL